MIDELSIIARYFRPLAGDGSFDLTDDAARLRPPSGRDLVVTTDTICAGVHFLPDDPPGTIAQKALRVNISDLAAKGAEPLAYTLSAAFPPDLDEDWLAAFCAGLGADQKEFSIALLGGDTVTMPAGAPVLSVTAIGTLPAGAMVHRFAAGAGDALYVSGSIGRSAAGLALLQSRRGPWDDLPDDARADLIQAYRVPQPRTALAPVLRACASAAMDVSDGLVGDCDKLAGASGCTAMIEAERIPLPPSLPAAAQDTGTIAALITGGDDYEILAAVPPDRERDYADQARSVGIPVTRIGSLRAGRGLSDVSFRGERMHLPGRSYVHGKGNS